jgi:DHA2 family multidrug resistance protein
MGATGGVLYGSTALLPIFMQRLLGYTALTSGLAMTPRGLGSMVSMILIGRLLKRADPRLFMAGGFVLLAATCLRLSHLSLMTSRADISWTLVLNGLAMGFVFVPMTTMTMGTLKHSQIGQGTGIYALLRNLGASVGISMMVNYQSQQVQAHHAVLTQHVSLSDPVYRQWAARLASALGSRVPAVAVAYRQVLAQASLLSFNDCFRALGIVCVFAIPAVALFRAVRHPQQAHMIE